MTVSTNIKCDVCEHTLTIKSQMDDSILIYDWPIEIVCPNCNNHMALRMHYPDGILPSEYKDEKNVGVIHIGYSATLPILSEIYYKEGMGMYNPLYSAFMNLCGIYGTSVVGRHNGTIGVILSGIIPYKNLLKEVLPFVKTEGDPTALLTKMARYFKEKEYKIDKKIKTTDVFNDMVETIYRGLSTIEYNRQKTTYFKEVMDYIGSVDKAKLEDIIQKSNSYQDNEAWLLEKAYSHIAEMTNHIEQYLPAIFYSSIGDFQIPHHNNLNILTIDDRQVNTDYSRGFEILIKIIPFLVALHNMMRNGDCNHYKESSGEDFNVLARFSKMSGGKKKEEIERYEDLARYLEYTIENHIRNGENHESTKYDVYSQMISYYYNSEKPELVHEERLIDVCFRTYLQFMRIMEIGIILHKINQRLRDGI